MIGARRDGDVVGRHKRDVARLHAGSATRIAVNAAFKPVSSSGLERKFVLISSPIDERPVLTWS